jgi:putative peptidoglycan lipid II flippase
MSTKPRAAGAAAFVALGILLSRLAGLVRLRAFAYYFGQQSDPADAFNAAFRIPNLLQNLFGEGALSASFIPVYASLVSRGERREADRVAAAVGALLALVVAAVVLAGVVATPVLIAAIAPGFSGEKRSLTIALVRILFPGAGILVLSAWCLGVLNSHGRFLLSYAAPVVWNAAMVATLVFFGATESLPRLAVLLAWGSVGGSALQFAVQIPAVLRVAPDLSVTFDIASQHLRAVVRNFLPVFISRGVVQVSAYIDALLASLLPTGAVTALANAQLIYTLPISLFGMSVAAAELPAMAGESGAGGAGAMRERLDKGLRQIAFFAVPSAVAFLALGDVVAAALLQTGRFQRADAVYVWGILAGASIGLLASTLGRLYASAFYALRDTRTPLRYALVHVTVATVLGYALAIPLPSRVGVAARWGAVGLTFAAGIGGWVEMLLLRRTLSGRVGPTGLQAGYVLTLSAAAVGGACVGWAVRLVVPEWHPLPAALVILGSYGVTFLTATTLLRVPEASGALARIRRSRKLWKAR